MATFIQAGTEPAIRAHLARRYPQLHDTTMRGRRVAVRTRTSTTVTMEPSVALAWAQAAAVTLQRPAFAVRVLNNMTFGATLADVAAFNALGSTEAGRLTAYVDQQLNWASIDDSALEQRLADGGYTTLSKSQAQLWSGHVLGSPAYAIRMLPAWETQRAAIVRAMYSKRQLRESMVSFWHDHFNVTATDGSAGPVYPYFDRQLRLHAFGNFRALLEAVAQSTSMLYYLDNRSNTRSGPNENFARELLELHTLGAENYLGFMDPFAVPPCPEDPTYPIGYTDIDVYETAAAFTGWTVKDGNWQYPNENDGTFAYRQEWHDAGPKFVLGQFMYPEQPALKDGRDILDRLANHPRVASFICKKLIRHFLDDDPDPVLVQSAAAVFRENWRSSSQIKLTLRHILLSATARSVWGRKSRRPFETMVAAMRVSGCTWTPRVGHQKSDELMWRLGFTGHSPFEWPAPNGYPNVSTAWAGANSMAMTWKLLGWLTEANDAGIPLMPILHTTRSMVPRTQWTATRLVDYWCRRVLGYLPAASRRTLLISFMAQNGNPDTHVIADTDTWSMGDLKNHYNQQRLRSMVSMILTSPEFFSR